jgi:hypothetical protein
LVASVVVSATVSATAVILASWLAITCPRTLWAIGVIEVVPNLAVSVVEIGLVELTQFETAKVFEPFQVIENLNNVRMSFKVINVAIVFSHNSFPFINN